ncbi:MAG: hypothetical protein AAF363_00685 [Bacteroidota bacterium]
MGCLLLVTSFFILAVFNAFFAEATEKLSSLNPLPLDYSGVTFLSLLLSVILAHFLNMITDEKKAIIRAIDRRGNNLEKILMSSWENDHMISISLKSSKIYVGWIVNLPKPTKMEYISVLPAFSGYRDEKTKQVELNTQYLDVYQKLELDDQLANLNEMDFVIVIDEREIISANKFDQNAYSYFGPNFE